MTYNDQLLVHDRGPVIRDWLEALGLPMPTDGDIRRPPWKHLPIGSDGDGQKNTIGFAYNAVFPAASRCFLGYTDSRWVKMKTATGSGRCVRKYHPAD